ncbi:MAG: HAD family hydrolase [Fidelibacterota bacterium]
MIKAVLFDLDGVVIDSEPLYEKVEMDLLAPYGISLSDRDQRDLKGTTEQGFYALIESRYRPGWNRDEVIRKGRRLLLEVFSRELTFVPGFVALMDRITGRFRTAVVTSTPKWLVDAIRGMLPLDRFFSDILCADDISNGKPHPEPYLTMMARLRVRPQETVIIEDSLHGVTSAVRSGAFCIALAGSFSVDELQEAHRVVESRSQIDRHLIDGLAR